MLYDNNTTKLRFIKAVASSALALLQDCHDPDSMMAIQLQYLADIWIETAEQISIYAPLSSAVHFPAPHARA